MLRVVHEGGEREGRPGPQVGLDELCRLAAQEMLAVALEAERQAYLERHAAAVDEEGRRLVVGNGHARAREITTAAGRIAVQAPRIDDRRDGERYISALLPPYMRRSPKVSEVLPLLYLRGLSTGDFVPALSAFFGSEAGLSASTVSSLTEAWQAEHERWRRRSGNDNSIWPHRDDQFWPHHAVMISSSGRLPSRTW